MHVCRTIAELREWRSTCTGSVGFVPTMGALHAGHRALLERMRRECDHAVCSIFVNPTQFGPHEDLASYPRPFEADLALCAAAGVDTVFAPAPDELYREPRLAGVEVRQLSSVLEGAARPGHFTGVATVVLKLFNIVQPQRAYFGEKDYQQLCVIRTLVDDLNVPVLIVPCPTVREADGLALSSRNAYLAPAERAAAPRLHEALFAVQHAYQTGERDAAHLIAAGAAVLNAGREPHFELDYLALTADDYLTPAITAHANCRVLIAARLGRTRLIDNVPLVEPASADAALGTTTTDRTGGATGELP